MSGEGEGDREKSLPALFTSSGGTIEAPLSIPSYQIVGRIARGGMGSVYLARRAGTAGFKRFFAIKVMHEHLAESDEFVRMFLDEARIAAGLHHPNVVPIVDVGEHAGRQFVVMDYVEGLALQELLKRSRKRRPVPELVSIFRDFLLGLHAAHELTDDEGSPLNLVHRDVSPQNVLVGVDGIARIIDFGVAKAESRLVTTMPGVRKGKLAYMAPEQLHDQPIDRRVDIFSAGAVLWSALTGEHLFRAESDAAIIRNLLELKITRPSEVGLGPPPDFDAICLKALQRDPADRYQTAAEMADDITQVAAKIGALGTSTDVAKWMRDIAPERLEDLKKQKFAPPREDDEGASARFVPDGPSARSASGSSKAKPGTPVSGVQKKDEPISEDVPIVVTEPSAGVKPVHVVIVALLLILIIGGAILGTRGGSEVAETGSDRAPTGSTTAATRPTPPVAAPTGVAAPAPNEGLPPGSTTGAIVAPTGAGIDPTQGGAGVGSSVGTTGVGGTTGVATGTGTDTPTGTAAGVTPTPTPATTGGARYGAGGGRRRPNEPSEAPTAQVEPTPVAPTPTPVPAAPAAPEPAPAARPSSSADTVERNPYL